MSPRAVLDVVAKKTFSVSAGNRTPVVQLVGLPYAGLALLVLHDERVLIQYLPHCDAQILLKH
jgi:hypothetical protein